MLTMTSYAFYRLHGWSTEAAWTNSNCRHDKDIDIGALHHVEVVGISLEYRVDLGDLLDIVGDGGVLKLCRTNSNCRHAHSF